MKRIYVDMCADLFHAGHVSYLKQVKELYEDGYVIVGIHSDETIESYKRTPVCTMAERAHMVRACRYCDEVIEDAPLQVSKAYLEQHGIEKVVHGTEISPEDVQKMYGPALLLGMYEEVPRTPNISTSDIIARIKRRSDLDLDLDLMSTFVSTSPPNNTNNTNDTNNSDPATADSSEGKTKTKTKTIHCWSTPRTTSTALLYSFGNRQDCNAVDEPLYAHYLRTNPKIQRPYRQELLEQDQRHGNDVIKGLTNSTNSTNSENKPITYVKHIAKFWDPSTLNMDLLFGEEDEHMLLVRDPVSVVQSWGRASRDSDGFTDTCTVDDTGFPALFSIYREVLKRTGKPPVVVDSNLLVQSPQEVLTLLCSQLDIAFDESMLKWDRGEKAFDGLWAKCWYAAVHQSTSFSSSPQAQAYSRKGEKGDQIWLPLKESLQEKGCGLTTQEMDVIYEVNPIYEMMQRKALSRHPLNPGSSSTSFGPDIDDRCDVLTEPRNRRLVIWVGTRLVPRDWAMVSVFDSSVQGGDAVWEGVRVYNGLVYRLKEHLDRLFDSARALSYDETLMPTREFIEGAVVSTLVANGMYNDAHIRLTLTRGPKVSSTMNPKFNLFGSNLLVVPEWKAVGGAATYNNKIGIDLITATQRRNPPQCVDSKIHHCNMLNNILPKIQANLAGCADAVMLDMNGFVAETNATNIFIVKDGNLATPLPDACMPGITRNTIVKLAANNALNGIRCVERNISLAELHSADCVFTTGTMGELTPVNTIDGRKIGPRAGASQGSVDNDNDNDNDNIRSDKEKWPILATVQEVYRKMTHNELDWSLNR